MCAACRVCRIRMCHRCDRVRCKGVRRRNAAAHLHPAVARRYATLGGSSSLSSSLLGTGEWRPSLGPTRRATTSTERRIDALTSTTRGIDALTSTMRGIGCRCCSPSNRATGYRELRHDGTQVWFHSRCLTPTGRRRRCFEIKAFAPFTYSYFSGCSRDVPCGENHGPKPTPIPTQVAPISLFAGAQ